MACLYGLHHTQWVKLHGAIKRRAGFLAAALPSTLCSGVDGGQFDPCRGRGAARQLTDGLPAGGQDLAAVPAVPPKRLRNSKCCHILLPKPIFSWGAITRHDPDYFPLLVGNYILGGGGFDSRLMKAVRDQRGLTYGVYSQLVPQQEAGSSCCHFRPRQKQRMKPCRWLMPRLQQFVAEGATAAELTQAKSNLVGGFPLRMIATASCWAIWPLSVLPIAAGLVG